MPRGLTKLAGQVQEKRIRGSCRLNTFSTSENSRISFYKEPAALFYMKIEIMKCNGISRNPKHTKCCDSQSFVLTKPLSLRYKARKSSIRAADLPHPSHTTDLLGQPRRTLTPTAKLPALRSVWNSGHRRMADLETPPGGGTHPMGIRQSRALLFSIILELISPGLLALLRDIVSTLNIGEKK